MQILPLSMVPVAELLHGQTSWHDSGTLKFSLTGRQEWFIASKENWLSEMIIKKNKQKTTVDHNSRSCWFEDLKVPFGEGNNTKTAEKRRAPGK